MLVCLPRRGTGAMHFRQTPKPYYCETRHQKKKIKPSLTCELQTSRLRQKTVNATYRHCFLLLALPLFRSGYLPENFLPGLNPFKEVSAHRVIRKHK